jgi:hypothetical protein
LLVTLKPLAMNLYHFDDWSFDRTLKASSIYGVIMF